LLIADCKLAVSDIIKKLLDVRTHFITKVPTNFSAKIRDDIVRSVMMGTMDESPDHKGRLYYDTDSDTVLGKGVIRNLRFVAFSLPGGYEKAVDFIKDQGLKSFTKRISSLGKFHCGKDAKEAFDKALKSSYGAYTADMNVYFDKRLADKDPNGPCWRIKAKNVRVVESEMEYAAKAYSINVLVTNLPRGKDEDIRVGATSDMVIDAYLGQYRVEFSFRLIKSYLNVGRVYLHSPARQDAMIFLTSVTAMIHAVVDNILSPNLDSLPANPYEDPEMEENCLTMKHIIDFMVNTTVLYDREEDTMCISGAPGESAKAWNIVRELDIVPKLLLGY
jgi:transposase